MSEKSIFILAQQSWNICDRLVINCQFLHDMIIIGMRVSKWGQNREYFLSVSRRLPHFTVEKNDLEFLNDRETDKDLSLWIDVNKYMYMKRVPVMCGSEGQTQLQYF
jgi:hypothetical protein